MRNIAPAETLNPVMPKSVPLRLWPAIAIVVLQWVLRFGAPLVDPNGSLIGLLGGIVGGIALLVWWMFFSRASWAERGIGVALLFAVPAVVQPFLHDSVRTGMMGLLYSIYLIPVLSLAFVAWAVASRRIGMAPRLAVLAVVVAAVSSSWLLLRTDGITSAGSESFQWRWSETAEERLLASAAPLPVAPAAPVQPEPVQLNEPSSPAIEMVPTPPPAPATEQEPEAAPQPEWPGFRGPRRDGVVTGARIAADWDAAPPRERWKRAVGPGWSSFSVAGDRFYTQEQRGEEEVVACYRVSTGEPVWSHADETRFWEANAGAGPRGTPTIDRGHVYTLGATGILNALDADSGALLWTRNAAEDAAKSVPGWGFAGSPLVVGDTVIVALAGRAAAYDAATGEPRWLGPDGGGGYSSPHLASFDGVEQVLLMSKAGAVSVNPTDGKVFWEHPWEPKTRIVQPALLGGDGILMSGGDSSGMRRLKVSHGPDGWVAKEAWTSFRLKPYFNDFVVHEGHAYGFDGRILACIDLETGERRWKGGRYGQGQLLLLADQDLLLVLSEEGELALVGATPETFAEKGRLPALEGKTWNHPVLVGDTLLVRNDHEMAAFEL